MKTPTENIIHIIFNLFVLIFSGFWSFLCENKIKFKKEKKKVSSCHARCCRVCVHTFRLWTPKWRQPAVYYIVASLPHSAVQYNQNIYFSSFIFSSLIFISSEQFNSTLHFCLIFIIPSIQYCFTNFR